MLTTIQSLLLAVAIAEFLTGVVGNGFLVAWSLHNLFKYCTTTPYSLIVLGLAICRFHLQWLILVDLISFSYFLGGPWIQYLNIIWVFLSQANLCLAACLSVFYCIRIINFVHPVFMWLKQRVMRFGFCFFLGSLLPTFLLVPILKYNSIPRNISTSSLLIGWHYFQLLWMNMGSLVPFVVFLLSSSILIISLKRHQRRMLQYMEGRRDAQIKAHVAALKSLISFLLLYLIYFLATPFSIICKFPPVKLTEVLITEIFMAAYPSLHSAILIVGNPKIKQQFQGILWKIVCLWRCQQI